MTKRIRVMFSRAIDVEVEVPDDYNADKVRDDAVDAVIANASSVTTGELTFEGIEEADEDPDA